MDTSKPPSACSQCGNYIRPNEPFTIAYVMVPDEGAKDTKAATLFHTDCFQEWSASRQAEQGPETPIAG